MIDRTQEDIYQDHRLEALEKDVLDLKGRVASALLSISSHTQKLSQHEERLTFLDPLRDLLAHIETIKHLIDRMRMP